MCAQIGMVPEVGVEPTRGCPHRCLSAPRNVRQRPAVGDLRSERGHTEAAESVGFRRRCCQRCCQSSRRGSESARLARRLARRLSDRLGQGAYRRLIGSPLALAIWIARAIYPVLVHVPQRELENPRSVARILTIVGVLVLSFAMISWNVPPKPRSRSQ
jgi:hypothetical protein